MGLLEFEAKVLGHNPGAKAMDEASKDDSLGLLLEGIQDDIKHSSWV